MYIRSGQKARMVGTAHALAGLGAHIPTKMAPAKNSKTPACYTLPPGLLENPIGVFHSYHGFFLPRGFTVHIHQHCSFPIYGPHTQVRDTLQDFTMIFRLASHTKLEIQYYVVLRGRVVVIIKPAGFLDNSCYSTSQPGVPGRDSLLISVC